MRVDQLSTRVNSREVFLFQILLNASRSRGHHRDRPNKSTQTLIQTRTRVGTVPSCGSVVPARLISLRSGLRPAPVGLCRVRRFDSTSASFWNFVFPSSYVEFFASLWVANRVATFRFVTWFLYRFIDYKPLIVWFLGTAACYCY